MKKQLTLIAALVGIGASSAFAYDGQVTFLGHDGLNLGNGSGGAFRLNLDSQTSGGPVKPAIRSPVRYQPARASFWRSASNKAKPLVEASTISTLTLPRLVVAAEASTEAIRFRAKPVSFPPIRRWQPRRPDGWQSSA